MKKLITVVFLILLVAVNTEAQELRCDNGRPEIGATQGEVLLKCGRPDVKDRKVYTLTDGCMARTVYIDTMIYDRLALHVVLTFTDGRMTHIERY
jgi:hypothetical protein